MKGGCARGVSQMRTRLISDVDIRIRRTTKESAGRLDYGLGRNCKCKCKCKYE